jgi:serine/threonine protein kinase
MMASRIMTTFQKLGKSPDVTDLNMTVNIGTPFYMSPEMHEICEDACLKMSDMWSLGIILYNLMFGKMPFEAKTEN